MAEDYRSNPGEIGSILRTMKTRRMSSMASVLAPGLALSAAFAISLSGRDAHASGYLTARFGADHGNPAMANGYALYFNPVALGGTKGTTITGDLTLAIRWASYERSEYALSPTSVSRTDPAYVQANTGKASLLNALPLPFASIHTDFGSDHYRAGYAFYIPFGGAANWDRSGASANPTVAGAVDGPQRWHNISGVLLAMYNTFAVAYTRGGWSLGVSVSPIIHSIETTRARNIDGSDDTSTSDGQLVEGRNFLKASGVNIGMAFGLYYEPEDKNFSLGLSYTSQPGFGETRMSGEVQQAFSNSPPGGTIKRDFVQSYPDIIRLGGVQKFGKKVELRSDLEYVRWRHFDKQCVVEPGTNCDNATASPSPGNITLNIQRNWKDSIGLRAGPAWHASENLELFASGAITTPAVPKSTIDASTIDSVRFYGTLGGKYDFSQHFSLAASYNHIYFIPVTTDGASSQQSYGKASASQAPKAEGTYKSQVGLINLNASYTF
jgi:long-chain fatty acid transport protein